MWPSSEARFGMASTSPSALWTLKTRSRSPPFTRRWCKRPTSRLKSTHLRRRRCPVESLRPPETFLGWSWWRVTKWWGSHADPHGSRASYRWTVDTSIYLADSIRGRGAGSTLYSELLQTSRRWAMSQPLPESPCNQASVALHRKVGFVETGRFPVAGYKLGAWWGRESPAERSGRPVGRIQSTPHPRGDDEQGGPTPGRLRRGQRLRAGRNSWGSPRRRWPSWLAAGCSDAGGAGGAIWQWEPPAGRCRPGRAALPGEVYSDLLRSGEGEASWARPPGRDGSGGSSRSIARP